MELESKEAIKDKEKYQKKNGGPSRH